MKRRHAKIIAFSKVDDARVAKTGKMKVKTDGRNKTMAVHFHIEKVKVKENH